MKSVFFAVALFASSAALAEVKSEDIKVSGWKCDRCEHTWVPRGDTSAEPSVCPKCKSPYWNKPRRRPKKPKK